MSKTFNLVVSSKVDIDVYKALRTAARAADRSVSQEVRRILRAYLEQQLKTNRQSPR